MTPERIKRYSKSPKGKAARRRYYEKNKKAIIAKAKAYNQAHRDLHRKASIKWSSNNKARVVANGVALRLRQKYGMTVAEYQRMSESQSGVCAIKNCGREINHVDHCHTTKKVRGLLCKHCNWILGFSGESPARLLGIVDYLKAHNDIGS